MTSIWKLELCIVSVQTVCIPYGSEILCVQNQDNKLCMWFKVPDTSACNVIRYIDIYSTGGHYEEINGRYIGTVQIHDMVWHVFEKE